MAEPAVDHYEEASAQFPLVTFSEGPTLPAVSQTPRELLLQL